MLRLRRVLGELPHPGRAERVHGRRPPLRHRQLRPDRPRPARCTPGRSSGRSSRSPWPRSSPCSCTRPRPPERGVAGHLRVHPRRADPQPRASWSWSWSSPPVWSASRRWPGRSAAAAASRCARSSAVARRCAARPAPLWSALAVETLGQRRYRDDCDADAAAQPWYLRRWFLHAATMWGFLGLLAATILDYGLALVGHQGDRHARPDLVPGPPARHDRRDPAGLRRDDAHRAALPRHGSARSATRPPPTGPSWPSSGSPG